MSFEALFTPRAAAVFGSVAPGKLAGILIDQLLGFGFTRVYAMNPKGLGKDKVPGFISIADVPDTIDLAVIAAPAEAVPQIMEECGVAGVKAAVIISSGFSEAGNKAGEARIQQIADCYGMRFIGPNCAGMINTHHRLAPTLQAYPPKGVTAVISQSGAVGGAIMEWAGKHGLGISKFVSYGNGADLNQVEFLRYLKDDPETKVVAVYMETVNDGVTFMDALRELTAVKPVIVIKSGRSSSGQRAALSHTGSMAGADAVYEAAFKSCGAIRVDTLDDMIDLCKGFSYLPPVKGQKVAIITNSGGPGVMAADLGESLGLSICDTSADLQETLHAFLPDWAGFHNPIDMTVEGTGENYRKAIEACLKEYDAALSIAFCPPYLDTSTLADGILQAFRNTGKPVFAALETGSGAQESVIYMREHGLPNFPSPEQAMRVIAYMAAYEEHLLHRAENVVQKAEQSRIRLESRPLEPDAMAFLERNGIAVPPYRLVKSREEAVQAGLALGYPVVMKVVSPEIVHKSDVGGVKLSIKDEPSAIVAFDALQEVAKGKTFSGVIMYPMLKGAKEVILGFMRDRQFGPVILFGMGGVYTEVVKDICLRIAPVNERGAMEMIKSIRGYPILVGVRGESGIDIKALAKMIASFSQIPFRHPEIQEIDINPIFAFPDAVFAADVRIIL